MNLTTCSAHEFEGPTVAYLISQLKNCPCVLAPAHTDKHQLQKLQTNGNIHKLDRNYNDLFHSSETQLQTVLEVLAISLPLARHFISSTNLGGNINLQTTCSPPTFKYRNLIRICGWKHHPWPQNKMRIDMPTVSLTKRSGDQMRIHPQITQPWELQWQPYTRGSQIY
jgi:hypothetical protein